MRTCDRSENLRHHLSLKQPYKDNPETYQFTPAPIKGHRDSWLRRLEAGKHALSGSRNAIMDDAIAGDDAIEVFVPATRVQKRLA